MNNNLPKNGWIKHRGAVECPVDKRLFVEVQYHNGKKEKVCAAGDLSIDWKNVNFYRKAYILT